MTLTFCRIFQAIVNQGNFLKAAEMLHMTPSAVSHAVADAEEEIGFRLFNRTRSGISMTENSKELYPAMLALINSEESLKQSVDRINGLKGGVVKVGIFNSVCTNWMPEILDRFSALYPGIAVTLYEGSYDDVVFWIKNGFVDFGFLSTSCTSELPVEGFFADPLVCIVPPDFKTAEDGFITIDEMKNQQFVIQREGSDADVQTLFKKYGLKYHTNSHILDDTSVMTMVSCGRGMSVMPTLTAKGLEGNLKVLRIKPEEHRVIGLSALDKKTLSPSAKQFYKCITEYIADIADEGNAEKIKG